MVQQTVLGFKIETTKERLTAHGGLALMGEFNHGIGLRELTDQYLPRSRSNRGFDPSVMLDTVVLMLQGGGRSLEDLRELKNEEGLMKLIGRDEIAEPDTVGDWLWMKHTMATFRWKMVQVAGRIVVKHAGEMILKLMIDLEKLELFRKIREKSFELSLCPDG